jgi:replicative superfamily II helicase
MEKIFCGKSGTGKLPSEHKLSDISLDPGLISALISFYGADVFLRPAQEVAIFKHGLLSARSNVILSTPTNSGKSLLAYLLAFREALAGKKSILVEPLRALAQEKVEELKEISQLIVRGGGPKVKVSITTGDYRLNDEFMGERVRDGRGGKIGLTGEIIVATPERLDAISRIREQLNWFEDVGLVCIDEAHLLGDKHRGATLELLITFLRTLGSNPQIILLSATVSNSDELAKWLEPCVVVSDVPRYPELEKHLYCAGDGEDINGFLVDEMDQVLSEDNTSVLIFVYRTDWAESLALTLADGIENVKIKKGDLRAALDKGYAWYHAGMSASSRMAVRQALMENKVRVVVSSTALAFGVNLPTTHVFVRDITFPGIRELDVSELLQMIGRAGRGDRPGVGAVFHRPADNIGRSELADGLKKEIYPRLVSQLCPVESESYYGRKKEDINYLERAGNQIMGILNRLGPVSKGSLEEFMSLTWGGKEFLNRLDGVLHYLCRCKLTYLNEDTGEYDLTCLGATASRSYLPPVTAASMGQLIRDLLQDEPGGGHLVQLSQLDMLLILCLASPQLKPVVRYSKALEGKVANYMEGLPIGEKSFLFRQWIAGDATALMGSARIDANFSDIRARKEAYLGAFLAMFLYDLSKGVQIRDMRSRYRFNVEEIEEKVRDTALWLLYGLENLLEMRNFYYHLRAVCEVAPEEIRPVEQAFKRSSRLIFSLLPNLRYRSALGELVRGVKRVYPNAGRYPGEGTIRRLEEGGITSLKDLVGMSAGDLVKLRVDRRYSDMIVGYIERRRA